MFGYIVVGGVLLAPVYFGFGHWVFSIYHGCYLVVVYLSLGTLALLVVCARFY